jgi:hypothetical protein
MANTLAYYRTELITSIIVFMVQKSMLQFSNSEKSQIIAVAGLKVLGSMV